MSLTLKNGHYQHSNKYPQQYIRLLKYMTYIVLISMTQKLFSGPYSIDIPQW